MVSTRLKTSGDTWQPVARPLPRSIHQAQLNKSKPPPIKPKPGGKVFYYVYEAPGNSTSDVGSSEQYSQLPLNGSQIVPLDRETFLNLNEREDDDGRIINKVRRQAKEAGKGFEVLARVTPTKLHKTSRGGKMFIKQRDRMEKFTSSETKGKTLEYDEEISDSEPSSCYNNTLNVKSYTTSSPHYNGIRKTGKLKNQLIPPLRSPPPEWRDKVEANYRIESRNSSVPQQRWNSRSLSYLSRSGSAPPPYQTQFSTDSTGSHYDRRQAGSAAGMHSESENAANPASIVHFDARKHKQAPHRKQGLRAGRGVFTTTPYIEHDFNARAVGWSKAYANQY